MGGMDKNAFVSALQQRIDHALIKRDYYKIQSAKFTKYYYWTNFGLGLCAIAGGVAFLKDHYIGAFLTSAVAFIGGQILPLAKWTETAQAFKDEWQRRERIVQSCEDVIGLVMICTTLDELMVSMRTATEQMQRDADMAEKPLRFDEKCMLECEQKVRRIAAERNKNKSILSLDNPK